jgi:hypothetical protein
MNIDRRQHGHAYYARSRVTYCLDQLEKAEGFCKGLAWETRVVPFLVLEEIIGALVAAEQHLRGHEDKDEEEEWGEEDIRRAVSELLADEELP